MKLFAFGLGYTAVDFIARHGLVFEQVAGTSRSAEKAAELRSERLATFVFGKDEEDPAIAAALRDSDVLLVSVPPGASADPVLAKFGRLIAAAKQPMKIFYLSTIGVYGDRGGEWVDEERLPQPKGERSKLRLQAEKAWLSLAKDATKTVHILRLSGIYGPGRNALAALKAGSARRIVKQGQVFNRIHVADISAVLDILRNYQGGSEIWNLSDDEPAPPQDVVTYAASLLGIEPPPEQSLEEAALSPLARGFYDENKRASNDKIKQKLGIRLAFPTYREGLNALWEAGEGRS
ncbi:MAG: SDR family oxidoreductase [Beijerinckiaceae bacterium]